MKRLTLLAVAGAVSVLPATRAGVRPVSGPLPPVHVGLPPARQRIGPLARTILLARLKLARLLLSLASLCD